MFISLCVFMPYSFCVCDNLLYCLLVVSNRINTMTVLIVTNILYNMAIYSCYFCSFCVFRLELCLDCLFLRLSVRLFSSTPLLFVTHLARARQDGNDNYNVDSRNNNSVVPKAWFAFYENQRYKQRVDSFWFCSVPDSLKNCFCFVNVRYVMCVWNRIAWRNVCCLCHTLINCH